MFIISKGSARRLGAGAAFGALVASSLLLVSPASAATISVTEDQIAPNDLLTDVGWHQGYDNANYASGISSKGLSSIGKSKILKGYEDNDNQNLTTDGVNAPVSKLVGASYDVVSGEAAFQALVWIDSDGPGPVAPVNATLRPEVAATGRTTIAATDSWVSNKAFGTIAANTPAALSTYITAIETGPTLYKTAAFGVLTPAGATSTVSSISFNDDTYEFKADKVSKTTIKDSQVATEETSGNYNTWHQGYADATGRQQVTGAGLELSGKSQVLKGFDDTSTELTSVNAKLASVIPDASYTVESGSAHFQIALRFDNGDGGGLRSATLRSTPNTVNGTTKLSLGDDWQSSETIGDHPANTEHPLSDIVSTLGNYKVIGYGVLTNQDESAIVSKITFGKTTTTFADPVAAGKLTKVVPAALAPDEKVYAGWHQGADPETANASIADGMLKLGAERSQVIKGYSDNSRNTVKKNVDLAEALRTASFNVTSGDVFFQIPLFFDDGAGATQSTTLQPAVKADKGVNSFNLGDRWISSEPMGAIPANTPTQLGDIVSAIGSYKVRAFGVSSDAGGNGAVSNITWNGTKFSFSKVASTTKITRLSPAKPSARSHLKAYITVRAPGATVAGGKVTLKYKTKTVGTGTVTANGTVRIALNYMLKKGTRTLTANFAGTSTTLASSRSMTFTVAK